MNNSFLPNKILLTGANGFIGSVVLKELVSRGFHVVAITRNPFKVNEYHGFVEFVTGNLCDENAIEEAIKECDCVIHCAGVVSFDSKKYTEINNIHVEIARKIIRAGKKNCLKRFVYVSSHWVLGFSYAKDILCSENTPLNPDGKCHNVYQKSKFDGEQAVIEECGEEIDAVMANPTQVWGPENKNAMFNSYIKKLLTRRFFIVPSAGINIIDVKDAASGIVEVCLKGRKGNRYIIGGENITYSQLLKIIFKARGFGGKIIEIPTKPLQLFIRLMQKATIALPEFVRDKLSFIETALSFRYYSSKKAEVEIGFFPKYLAEQTVLNTVYYLGGHRCVIK